jgi:SulP family sulfate permease
VRVAPRSDLLVLLTCFFLTVVFDMVVAVAPASPARFLFMRRMAEPTTKLAPDYHPHLGIRT